MSVVQHRRTRHNLRPLSMACDPGFQTPQSSTRALARVPRRRGCGGSLAPGDIQTRVCQYVTFLITIGTEVREKMAERIKVIMQKQEIGKQSRTKPFFLPIFWTTNDRKRGERKLDSADENGKW